MKKILLLIDCLWSGGAQRQMVGLAKLLKEEGYAVRLVYYYPYDFYKQELDDSGVENVCVARGWNVISCVYGVAKSISLFAPDVVISYLDTPNIIVSLLKMLGMHYKLLVSERNTTQHVTYKGKLKFYMYRWADRIIVNSYSQGIFIKNNYPELIDKLCVITNFVDLNRFCPVSEQYPAEREMLRILGVGRIDVQKNIECLISAAKLLTDEGYAIKVDWYGRNGELKNKLESMASELGLKDIFIFHESTRHIEKKYQEADLFCLPSYYEGFPNVICEAMASGLPVVCSDVCDNPRLVSNGVNGYLFNPNIPYELASCIESYIHLPEEKKHLMQLASRKRAMRKFGKSNFIEKYKELLT